jgi:outer membrane lipoprotein-sorting protein
MVSPREPGIRFKARSVNRIPLPRGLLYDGERLHTGDSDMKIAMSIARLALAGILLLTFPAAGEEEKPVERKFEDEAEAHALYDLMTATMRKAKTLSWVSVYRTWSDRYGQSARCVYRIWLKKPNHVRLEASIKGEVKGILVGDGRHFWTYWPNGRPQGSYERSGKKAKEYERTKNISYMKKRSPPGMHSIGHETGPLGAGLTMPILDPSTFHGYTDSLQRYVDAVRSLGTENVRKEECDVIEVSIMRGQRSWKIWLSKKDHLPRRIEQTIRARFELHARETWTSVKVDAEIPDESFVWTPPEGWVQHRRPTVDEGLLAKGVAAPDFDLPLHGGGRFKLSEHRGKVVWLYIWRAG